MLLGPLSAPRRGRAPLHAQALAAATGAVLTWVPKPRPVGSCQPFPKPVCRLCVTHLSCRGGGGGRWSHVYSRRTASCARRITGHFVTTIQPQAEKFPSIVHATEEALMRPQTAAGWHMEQRQPGWPRAAQLPAYTRPGSNWRPPACWADVIATRPRVPIFRFAKFGISVQACC